MKKATVLILLLAFSGAALAGEVKVKIPQEGWSITFESPPLSQKQESRKDGQYAFRANSGRFNISLFVERPRGSGSSHKDVKEFYSHANQRISGKDTVVTLETPKYVRVQYDQVTDFQGKPIRQRHINYYFAFSGKWVDVHISVVEPSQKDGELVAAFDRSLSYGP